MSDVPPVIVPSAVPRSDNLHRQMARASWLAPIIAFAVNFMLIIGQGGNPGKPNLVQGIVGAAFIFGGLILGVFALLGIRKYGTAKILIPALVGIGINLFLIVMGALPIVIYMANRAHLQPVVHSASAHLLKDDHLHFSIDIPDGFREYPEGKRAPTIEHVYVKGVVGGGEALTVINIERMDGLIPRNRPLAREQMPPGFKGELTTRNWRGLKVDTIVAPVDQSGANMIVYTMQIPLRPAAIQLNVGGPASKQTEIDQLVDTLLASLDGDTNW